jgi:hypothetical protein
MAQRRDGESGDGIVTVQPMGWIGDWQENPRPNGYPLSGHWFVESTDGVRVEIGPSETLFGENQNTRQVDGKRGTVRHGFGPGPAVLMLAQFEMIRTAASACQFR